MHIEKANKHDDNKRRGEEKKERTNASRVWFFLLGVGQQDTARVQAHRPDAHGTFVNLFVTGLLFIDAVHT